MKSAVLGALLLIYGSQASAVFVSATWEPPGNEPLQSFARLLTIARGFGDEQTLRPLPLPYTGNMTASASRAGDASYAYAAATYNLGADFLQVDVTRLDRNAPSSAISNGAWVFSVTETVRTTAAGMLVAQASGSSNEHSFEAYFTDLTTGARLFKSVQADSGNGVTYELGGLVGNRAATFEGSLENILTPGHVYGLTYLLGVSNSEAASDSSQATGRISLSAAAVPEPGTYALFSFGILAVVIASRKLRARKASLSTH